MRGKSVPEYLSLTAVEEGGRGSGVEGWGGKQPAELADKKVACRKVKGGKGERGNCHV